MSFRARLTRFFLLIVVIPMIAVGFLVFRLISESQQAKTDARGNGVLTAAVSLYRSESAAAAVDARSIARALSVRADAGIRSPARLRAYLGELAAQAGLARLSVTVGPTAVDIGDAAAVAPGSAAVQGRAIRVTASELSAPEYVHDLAGPGLVVLVRQAGRVLASSSPALSDAAIPADGPVTRGGASYRAQTQRLPGFLLLALSFAAWASRGLQGQVSRFLQAARRLAGGDFSAPIRIEGHDEFAALGQEFNNMSSQLAQRLEELSQERARLREAIRRIGQTFAANLDRQALLELALKTAIDAVQASGGRVIGRAAADSPLEERTREGELDSCQAALMIAERVALETGEAGEGSDHEHHALAVPLGSVEAGGRIHGVITVARERRPFTAADRELLRSLGSQATLALENVDLHLLVSRQAVTDELTGLTNHRRFQELLSAEIEQVRRYHHPIALIMLDIDNFKLINDTYGHQQGDLVLRRVARVLAETSREADFPARYGGEELAVILPHTDLDGAYAIAERIRTAIASMRIPRLDERGELSVTASLGVASFTDGDKDALIAEADAALYEAKRQGKNRTVRGPLQAANVLGAE